MRIIVTGGNSGLGQATATALAAAGHSVVIACRSMEKAHRAAAAMHGDVTVRHLDLADLSSVRRFADSVDTVDVLINNAGVLGLPLTRTVDGFEAHIGTNHLGHFALTCLLGERITDRVVCVSSAMYVFGRLDLDDLNWHRRRYWKWAAYTQSKLPTCCSSPSRPAAGARVRLRPGCRGHRHHPRQQRGAGLVRAAQAEGLSTVRPAVAGRRRTGHDRGGGDRPAKRSYLDTGSPIGALPNMLSASQARYPYLASRSRDLSADLTGCDWVGSLKEISARPR